MSIDTATTAKTWWIDMDTSDPSEDAQDFTAAYLADMMCENGQIGDFVTAEEWAAFKRGQADIRAGRTRRHTNVEDLIDDLRGDDER